MTPLGPPADAPSPTALVTGASRGLGLALAGFLVEQDYHVVITARDAEALGRAATDLARYGPVDAIPGDVTKAAHRRALARVTGSGLDLLVNNASDLGATPLPPLADYSLARLRSVFETNLVAPLALVQALLPALEARGGMIVNISSDAARGGYAGWGGYGASKSALDLLSLTLATELPGVATVSVDPGDMRTRMHQDAFPGEDIGDRPLPEATLPFWAWLLGQPHSAVTGRRFEAQGDTWQLEAPVAASPRQPA